MFPVEGAGDRFHAQFAGLGHTQSHPVVLEGTRGIPAQVLDLKTLQPRVTRCPGGVHKWRVPFTKRHSKVIVVRLKREELAKAPHPALVEGMVGLATTPKGVLQLPGIKIGETVGDIQEIMTSGALVNAFKSVVLSPAFRIDAPEEEGRTHSPSASRNRSTTDGVSHSAGPMWL